MTPAFWAAAIVAALLAAALTHTTLRLRQRTCQLTNLRKAIGGDDAVRAAGHVELTFSEWQTFRHIWAREDT